MRALGRIALANMYTITCALSVRGHHKISSPPLTLPHFPPPSFYLLSSTVRVSPFPLAMFPFPFSRVRSPSEVIAKSLLRRSRFLAFLPRRSISFPPPPLTLPLFPPPSFYLLSSTVHVLTFPLAMFPLPFILRALRPRASQNLFSTAHAFSLSSPVVLSPFPHGARFSVSARHVSVSLYPVRSPSEVITKSLLHRSRPLTSLPRRSSFPSPSAPLFFDICGQNAENRRLSYTRRHMRLRRFPRSKGTKCPFFGT